MQNEGNQSFDLINVLPASFFSSGFSNFPPQQQQQPSSSSTIQDLIKCFCGVCESFFKRHSIEYALKANGEEILRDIEAREILKKFLIFRKGSSHSKSPAEEIVECFELAEAILQGKKELEDVKDELEELLFTEYWVKYSSQLTQFD